MIPNYFNLFNSFSIDGDIACVYKHDSNNNCEISYYNLNPNKIYDHINFYNNFIQINDINNVNQINNINFYNFNQDNLVLYCYPNFFLNECKNLKKLNFDGTIELKFYVPLDVNCSHMFFNTVNLDLSNIKLSVECNNIDFSAQFAFANSNIFDSEKNFYEYDTSFIGNANNLTSCFMHSSSDNRKITKTFNMLTTGQNSKYPELRANDISNMFKGLKLDYNILGSNFFNNISLTSCNQAIGAFTTLYFNQKDILSLVNGLPKQTDGALHRIGVGVAKDVTPIEAIENLFNDNGWTVTINQE